MIELFFSFLLTRADKLLMWGDGESSRISPAESAADKKYQKNRVKMLDFSETTFHNIASNSLPRDIDEEGLIELVERAKDYCLMHGEQCNHHKPNNDDYHLQESV